MIAQIEGNLISLETVTGIIKVGQISYEIMLPGYAIGKLAGKIGTDIVLYTMQYLEGTPGKGNMVPRLVGFLDPSEKDFFNKYTSVKGMGIKKGLKSLTIPIETIASAIESGDEKMLQTLPAVGKRLSQLIIAELTGKVEEFAMAHDATAAGVSAGHTFAKYQVEALEILVAWGEKRNEAMELIALTCKKHPDIKTAEDLVPLVYRVKQGIEV
jgi:Holliday junction DNA helicase RuvA